MRFLAMLGLIAFLGVIWLFIPAFVFVADFFFQLFWAILTF